MTSLSIKERIKAALPKSKLEFGQLTGSFLGMLVAKFPFAFINLTIGNKLVEEMKENPELIPVGVAAFALIELGMCAYDYSNMIKGKVGASPKANAFYRALSFVSPEHHKAKAISAQLLTIGTDIVGISPDPSLFITTIQSIQTGDYTIALANRLSNVVITGGWELLYNSYIRQQNKKIAPIQIDKKL